MKFGTKKAELPLEAHHRGRGMKSSRGSFREKAERSSVQVRTNFTSSSPPRKPRQKIKEHEVLPVKVGVKFGAIKAELFLEYVINETSYKEFIGGGMKFGQAKSSSISSSSSRKSRQKKQEDLPRKLSQESGTKFGSARKAELHLKLVVKKVQMKEAGRSLAEAFTGKRNEVRQQGKSSSTSSSSSRKFGQKKKEVRRK
ncbi:hypothetical protein COCNU_15G002230 [Cocos nucifera]|uniref:Uncharacterized protein n=1 Tax=Cocos nucifera TaxID=13894 RepID=A0A8K0IYB7_COCNU|nr:hypothetical protein COCNU_15G002230 [Cocos nucifera]